MFYDSSFCTFREKQEKSGHFEIRSKTEQSFVESCFAHLSSSNALGWQLSPPQSGQECQTANYHFPRCFRSDRQLCVQTEQRHLFMFFTWIWCKLSSFLLIVRKYCLFSKLVTSLWKYSLWFSFSWSHVKTFEPFSELHQRKTNLEKREKSSKRFLFQKFHYCETIVWSSENFEIFLFEHKNWPGKFLDVLEIENGLQMQL